MAPIDKVSIEFHGDDDCPEVAVIRIAGELDSASIGKISRSFDLALEGKFIFAVVDMAKVSLISSAALGELMGSRTRFVERGGDVVLAGLGLSIREKLTAMDANKIFKFYGDVRSAVNAYKWKYHGITEKLDLSFPSQLAFVPPVRQLASRVSKQKGYSNRDSFRIETIVDEICNNAVEHGVQGDDCNIDLSIMIDRKKIELRVVNVSDPDKINMLKEISKSLFVPKMTDETKRGRGLALVKMLSSDFEIEYSDAGTSVHVTKLKEE